MTDVFGACPAEGETRMSHLSRRRAIALGLASAAAVACAPSTPTQAPAAATPAAAPKPTTGSAAATTAPAASAQPAAGGATPQAAAPNPTVATNLPTVTIWSGLIALTRASGSDPQKMDQVRKYIESQAKVSPIGVVPPPGNAGQEKLNLMLGSSGEQLDVFQGFWDQYQQAVIPINDLLDKYGADIKKKTKADWLQRMTDSDGKIW